MLISPFIAAVKKIKFGEFEAEIDTKEIQRIKSDAQKNLDLKHTEKEQKPEIFATTESIKELAKSDSVIALAKIRIELEKVLGRLAKLTSIEVKSYALGSLVNKLSNQEIITPEIGKALREVIGICNRAIHGESISNEGAETIIELGVELLEDLYWLLKDQLITGPIVKENIISLEDSKNYYHNKKYRLTSIIPLAENPKRVVRELDQEQLDEMLENYQEYAEFIIELVEIPQNG